MSEIEYKIDFNRRVFDRLQIPVIDALLMDKYYSFMLDTGSNGNIIDKDFFEDLKRNNDLNIVSKPQKIIAAGLIEEESVESVDLTIMIEGKEVTFPFAVVDLSNLRKKIRTTAGSEIEGLLGCRFFDHYNWILDFKEWCVWK